MQPRAEDAYGGVGSNAPLHGLFSCGQLEISRTDGSELHVLARRCAVGELEAAPERRGWA